jgi:uncharacterized membrane protein YoaK (UPF0700 family)
MDAKHSPSDVPFPIMATLFGLTFVTGLIDAVSFLGLGHVFTANMTGNVVFVGFAIGGAADLSVLRSLAALGAFASGSVVGGMVTSRRPRAPAGHLLIAVYAEILLLSVAVIVALVTGNSVTSVSIYLVIVCTAVAMGLRNAVVRKLAVPDLTTTVLTLTVTGLAADSRLAGGAGSRSGRRILSILAMWSGALTGAMLLQRFGLSITLISTTVVVAGFGSYLFSSDHGSATGRA